MGVRLRPVVTEAWEEEMASGWMEAFHSELDRNVLELDEEGQVCNSWSFDYVWGSEISTSSVYDDLAKRVVEQVTTMRIYIRTLLLPARTCVHALFDLTVKLSVTL